MVTTNLERVRYFPRQLITADDMRQEQDFFREKMRRHNRFLHGWGVVCGCEVEVAKDNQEVVEDNPSPWSVIVHGGYVITPRGDEILIPERIANKPLTFDLAGDWRHPYNPCPEPSPCSPARGTSSEKENTVYLAVCYTECNVRPSRIHPAGCGCDEAACEYSRIRESFELVRLEELPKSHQQPMYREWQDWFRANLGKPKPLPSCLDYLGDDCVVLASIKLPNNRTDQIVREDIFYKDRRVLLPHWAIMQKIMR